MYAVVFTYSFDQDCAVYLFQGEQSAKEFLKESFDEELRIEVEENGLHPFHPFSLLSDDGWFGKISDNADTAYYHVARVYE